MEPGAVNSEILPEGAKIVTKTKSPGGILSKGDKGLCRQWKQQDLGQDGSSDKGLEHDRILCTSRREQLERNGVGDRIQNSRFDLKLEG